MSVLQKVCVFESCCWLIWSIDFHISVESWSLYVIDTHNISSILESKCVAHENQINFIVTLHLDSINAVYSRNQWPWILFKVVVVFWQNLLHEYHFFRSHGLHDEATVVAKEEKASACSSSFTGWEYLLSIVFWVKRLQELLKVNPVLKSNPLEQWCR